jgi:hypothetical protein
MEKKKILPLPGIEPTVRIVTVPAEIPTRHILNKNQKHYLFTQLDWSHVFSNVFKRYVQVLNF